MRLETLANESLTLFPWISKFDLSWMTHNHYFEHPENPRVQFQIQTEGLLLYGSRYLATANFPPIGPDLARFLNSNFYRFRDRVHEFTISRHDAIEIENMVRVTAKVGLRLALSILVAEDAYYTHNIRDIRLAAQVRLAHDIQGALDTLESARTKPEGTKQSLIQTVEALDRVADMAHSVGVLQMPD